MVKTENRERDPFLPVYEDFFQRANEILDATGTESIHPHIAGRVITTAELITAQQLANGQPSGVISFEHTVDTFGDSTNITIEAQMLDANSVLRPTFHAGIYKGENYIEGSVKVGEYPFLGKHSYGIALMKPHTEYFANLLDYSEEYVTTPSFG